MADWNASSYHRISGPQFEWGLHVIERLAPAAGERILDLGCGTGRLTAEIRKGLGTVRVTGLDRSASMLAVARVAEEGERADGMAYVQGDGAALPFANAFDAVFSAATLHWIHDHDAVFRGVFTALRPGGRLVAQCGGAGNLRRLLDRADRVMSSAPYREFFADWRDPWNFAAPEITAARLTDTGFADVRTWIEASPVPLGSAAGFAEFVAVVCIRHHLDRLPPELRDAFTGELTAEAGADAPPYVLDYQRLNIVARKPPA